MAEQELTHYGVMGMKWGVRRYQPYGVVGKGKFLGKPIPKKKSINTAGLSLRDANKKRKLETSTTKGKKTTDVNLKAKAQLDKINEKQKTATSKKKSKITLNKGLVDGRTLSDEIIDNIGIVAVSSLVGGYAISKGKVEAGAFIGSMGGVVASTSMVVDILNRVDPVKK